MAEVAGSNPASPTTWNCSSTTENVRIGAGRCSKSSCTVKYTPVPALRPSPIRTLSAALDQLQACRKSAAEIDALRKRWNKIDSHLAEIAEPVGRGDTPDGPCRGVHRETGFGQAWCKSTIHPPKTRHPVVTATWTVGDVTPTYRFSRNRNPEPGFCLFLNLDP